MTDPDQDEAFEAFLRRRSVLPESFADKLEPPAALDHAVLNEAREAIRSGAAPDGGTMVTAAAGPTAAVTTVGAPTPGKQQTHRPPRWAVPVALAATVLLCLSVVLNVSLNTNRPTPERQRAAVVRAEAGADAGEQRDSISGDIPSNEVILPEAKVAGSPGPHAPVAAEPAAPAPHAPMQAKAVEHERVDATAAYAPHAPVQTEAATATAAPADEPRVAARSAAVAPHPADPKVWLRQIEALRAAGQNDHAAAEMSRFRAAFPDYAAKTGLPPSPGTPPNSPK
jgi:hypothetical protein